MSQHKQPKVAEGIITSDAVQGRGHRLPKKLLWPLVAIIVLAALAAAGFAYKMYVYDPAHKPAAPLKAKSAGTQFHRLDNALSDAQAQLSNARTPKERADAYVALGLAYENKNQNKQAIAAFQSALAADSSVKPTVLGSLGYAYARDGQRDKAVSTFQELIALLQQDKSSPYHDAALQAYQNDLKWLQEGKSI
jgi:tetratricopeptide (TPR) repeat protein